MLKKPVKTLSVLAALLSMHSMASATCTGTDCALDISAVVDFDASYNLDPEHKGIFIQINNGNTSAAVDLKNVVIRDNGNIDASATAVGNNIAVSLNSTVQAPVRHVSQSNFGNKLASVDVSQASWSKTGAVDISSVAIGNNFSLELENTTLAELSVAQCNVGSTTALTEFRWDPTSLTAAATAVGNNISIGAVRR